MKTLALTIAATLVASTSAFATDSVLFTVNDGVHRGANVQALDVEPTASVRFSERNITFVSDGARFQKDRNPSLFDVDD